MPDRRPSNTTRLTNGRLNQRLAATCAAWFLALLPALAPTAAAAQGEKFDCVVKPSMTVHLAAPVTGVIASIAVDRGDTVKKGEPIIQIEADAERASVALARRRAEDRSAIDAAKAKVAYLERKYERNNALKASKVISTGKLDEFANDLALARGELSTAEANADIAGLDLARSETQLAQKTVTSPIDGVVVERTLAPGEYWNEQDSILTIAALDPLHVETFVPIALNGSLSVGDKADVTLEEPIGGHHRVTVEVIDRVYDAASGTFGVRLTLANPDFAIPAGVRCSVSFAPGP